ncbi:MAG: CDP-alcohol phosphatidyltransferase family protein [Firmicutes bacterium]|nr:CDP-alcohol phosphatidyltransferase family protein [Bacillota bacterium]
MNINIFEVFNVPNILSFLRILLILPFSIYILDENYSKAACIILLSGLTDFLDGLLARHFDQVSKLGRIIDPVADKLTLLAIMICISIKFPIVVPLMIVLIAKEACMLVAGAIMLKKFNNTLTPRWYGKIGTICFYFSVTFIVMLKATWNIENVFVVNSLMGLTALLMMYALVRYFLDFIKIMRFKG